MKKLFYLIGAFVTVAAIFATIAVLLKKLKISLSIEGIDDEIKEEENADIGVSIDEDENLFDEAEDAVEEALEDLLAEEENKEIEVEISEI
ncbi:MAG: hypothetical protein IJZ20_01875 [Clostridia bacterium]|nr:hypothetical protein [Clostridia bacterium]